MNKPELLELMRSRRSVRRFKSELPAAELIHKALEAAISAPRAGNRQHWRIISVQSAGIRRALAAAVEREVARQRSHLTSPSALKQFDAYTGHFVHFKDAPVLLVLAAKPYDSIYTRIVSKVPDVSMGEMFEPALASAMMAAENLLLAATALGLGGCFLSGPLVAQRELERVLCLSPPEHVVGFIAIGYPADAPGASEALARRESVEDVFSVI